MMNIRPYEKKDKQNFIKICLVTANKSNADDDDAKFIKALYCDYYIEHEPHNCFALTDNNDTAVGYIICSDNYVFYKKNFSETLQHIKTLGFDKYLLAKGEIIGHGLYKKHFPAHLHIDILPEFQHSGGGTMLMNTLKAHLKAKQINAVHLMVNAENKNAVKFYKKNNFIIHSDFKKFYVMTCNF